jgi:hypothetical protein
MIAATLKQMAAAAAKVNSEIHMAQFPLSALTSPDPLSSAQSTRVSAVLFLELHSKLR